MIVFNAGVMSILLYGLETIPLTKTLRAKLDAFQMTCLRRIAKVDHPFYSRISNQKVLDMFSTPQHENEIERLNQIVKATNILDHRKIKTLGHVIRAPISDPMRQSSLYGPGKIYICDSRKVGRPKLIWTIDAFATTFEKILNSIDKGKTLHEFRRNKKEGKEPSNGEIWEFEQSVIRRIEEYQIEQVNEKYSFDYKNERHQEFIIDFAKEKLF